MRVESLTLFLRCSFRRWPEHVLRSGVCPLSRACIHHEVLTWFSGQPVGRHAETRRTRRSSQPGSGLLVVLGFHRDVAGRLTSALAVTGTPSFFASQFGSGFVVNDPNEEDAGLRFASGVEDDVHIASRDFVYVFERQFQFLQPELYHDERSDLVPLLASLNDDFVIWIEFHGLRTDGLSVLAPDKF